jgi:hypothetical protein
LNATISRSIAIRSLRDATAQRLWSDRNSVWDSLDEASVGMGAFP